MPTNLNIFPARIPIGTIIDADGARRDVLMTHEFARALSDLMLRVGGASSLSVDEIVMLQITEPTNAASVTALTSDVRDLEAMLPIDQTAARVTALERQIEDLKRLLHSVAPAPVDWEHPGKVGDKTPNSARFTTVNNITFTRPATPVTVTLVGGKTFTVSNTLALTATDGATLVIGGGGTLGTAAYKDVTAFAARSATALGGAATDAASTQTLVNNLRSVLLSVGIGS